MNLLFLSTAFPQPADPARAPYNFKLCEALAEEHRVTVISPVPWIHARPWRPAPVELSRLHYPTFVYPPGVLRDTHAWWLWRSIRATAQRAVDARPPDAVISYWTWPDGAAAARLARACGVPAIMMVGGSDVLVLAARPGHRRRVTRTLAQAAAVVAVSEQLSREVAALGVAPARIVVIRRGVDRAVFSPGPKVEARRRLGLSDSDALFIWAGRLTHVKGADLLIDALEQVTTRGRRLWRSVLVGDGPLRGALMRRVNRGVLRDRVAFIERLEPRGLADWYRAADALVLSSRSEGVPNVLYEAKACGTPVVATNVGDVAAFLDEGDYLIPPGDAGRLAAAIACVVDAPDRARPARRLPTWKEAAAELVEVIRGAAGTVEGRFKIGSAA